jgi:uncharacterized protein (DUF1697 family)
METFVALLRGINVSGRRPVPMAALRASLVTRGFREVVTYKASGNIVLDAELADAAGHARLIGQVIADAFGHDDVEVLTLRSRELRKIAAGNPLLCREDVDPAFLHVTFLSGRVAKSAFDRLDVPLDALEAAVFSPPVVYLYCPNGYGRTKINNTYFERALGVACTTRNWKTVLALAELVESR